MNTLAKLRSLKKLSVRELSAASGVSYALIYKLESGESKNMTKNTMTKLAAALGVPVHKLLSIDTESEARS